jgi:hypothetical protein
MVGNAKVTHSWGSNFLRIKGNGIVCVIAITKHLDNNKHLEVSLCYDFVNEITNEEEIMLLVAESYLFAIGTITLLELEILVAVVADAKIGTNVKIGNVAKINIDEKFNINAKIDKNPKNNIDTKINIKYPNFDFPHTLRGILVDITLA